MKNRREFKAVGLMSGTSLDGLDIAYARFEHSGEGWSYELLHAETFPYATTLKSQLLRAPQYSGEDLALLHVKLGMEYGRQCRAFIKKYRCKPDLIASHGHTVFHQPRKHLTLQIGDPFQLSRLCRYPVVADFRSLDVALGGQGAPLVPVGDHYLFGKYNICLNIGGISNFSLTENGVRKAWDISVANMLLNHLARKGNAEFDRDGEMARSGSVAPELLKELQDRQERQRDNPVSLGFEWASEAIFPLFENSDLPVKDQLATGTEFVCAAIADALTHRNARGKLLVTGGGAFNGYLMERLGSMLPAEITLRIPSSELISFKEALVFAFMGVLKMRGEPNCLKSVTGAERDNCGGVLYEAW